MVELENLELIAQQKSRTREICSLLIANGYLSKEEFRDLIYDESLRASVVAQLDTIGLKLLHNPKSEHWGVGLNHATAADDRLEWSNNFGLDRGALALLLILWCKLILPKRLADRSAESSEDKGDASTFFPELDVEPEPMSSINRDQIVAEFSDILGGVTLISKYISQLARANLIRTHGGLIKEGPLLALVVDESKLTDDLHRDVLLSVLKRERKDRA